MGWLLFMLGVLNAGAAEVRVLGDRMLEVDGKRLFVVGLYEGISEEGLLSEVAEAGFNLVSCGHDVTALDRLQAHGLYGYLHASGAAEFSGDVEKKKAALREAVARFGGHPALLSWELPDEALWNTMLDVLGRPGTLLEKAPVLAAETKAQAEAFVAGCAYLRELDPHHVIWMNHAAGNGVEVLGQYGRAADVIACDLYPVMPYPTAPVDYSRSLLGSIGICTTRMQASAPGKPYWMVLQGMGWGDFDNPVFARKPLPSQQPTYEESRFMAYDAIVRGARGVMYWGTYIAPKEGPLWQGILKTVRELKARAALLAAPDGEVAARVTTRMYGLLRMPGAQEPLGVRALPKVVEGKTWWIIVNELPVPATYRIEGVEALNGGKYVDGEGGRFEVREGVLGGALPRYGVRILQPE